MITYIDSNSAEKYTALFEEATKDLAAHKITAEINNIDRYLANLPTLAGISSKYVRLPVDEAVFYVDGDTRKITVPKEFSSNGVGIVGDELAEIVYFKIDRYFDIVDLASENMNIYIQWENASGEKGASLAYAKSVEQEEDGNDFVYFGWALTSKITGKAGNVKFNVRILKLENDTNTEGQVIRSVAYSFNTQTATVAIKAGLDYDFTNDDLLIEDSRDLIAGRLLEGNTAHCPQIITNINKIMFKGGTLSVEAQGIQHTAGTDGATHTDAEPVLTYQWFHKPLGATAYERLRDAKGTPIYTPSVTITDSGSYYCTIFATYEIVDGKGLDTEGNEIKLEYHTSTASSNTCVCTVPEPIKLEIKQNLDDKLILAADTNKLTMQMAQQELTLDSGKQVVISDLVCKLAKAGDGTKVADLSTLEFAEVDPTAYTVEKTEEKQSIAEVTVPYSGDTISAVLEVNEDAQGYYKMTVGNMVNNNTVDSDESVICRVTLPAQLPTIPTKNAIKKMNKDGKAVVVKNFQVGDTLYADFEEVGLSDGLDVIWKKVAGQGQDGNVDLDSDEELHDTEDKTIEGVNTRTLTVTAEMGDGSYYFMIHNTLNGTEVTSAPKQVTPVQVNE